MKRMILAMAALTAITYADGSYTQVTIGKEKTGIYAGASYTYVNTNISQDTFFDGNGDGSLIVGYNVLNYLAVEGRVSKTSWSVFAKPSYSFNNSLTVYGLFGTGQVKLTNTYIEDYEENVSRPYFEPSDKDEEVQHVEHTRTFYTKTSFQYGVGVTYNINRDVMVFADYTKPDADIDMINVGVAYRF